MVREERDEFRATGSQKLVREERDEFSWVREAHTVRGGRVDREEREEREEREDY